VDNYWGLKTFKDLLKSRFYFFQQVVFFDMIYFWMLVNTFNFLLPPEFRVLRKSIQAVVLGFYWEEKTCFTE